MAESLSTIFTIFVSSFSIVIIFLFFIYMFGNMGDISKHIGKRVEERHARKTRKHNLKEKERELKIRQQEIMLLQSEKALKQHKEQEEMKKWLDSYFRERNGKPKTGKFDYDDRIEA